MKLTQFSQKKRARIEIIPLIDIMFFLVATFMMVSISMIKNKGIDVSLPAAKSAEHQTTKDEATVVSIDEKGQIFWGKSPISREELQARAEALHTENPKARVVLHGDKRAEYGIIVDILDKLRQTGIAAVSIQTQPGEQNTQP